jgi:hypothetical protein
VADGGWVRFNKAQNTANDSYMSEVRKVRCECECEWVRIQERACTRYSHPCRHGTSTLTC